MGKYKVVYFNAAGRAEVIRMMLAAAGVDFDDERITFEQWGALKPTIPSGQLPAVYTPCGKILSQSGAIARFVARQHGLYSNDDWQVYHIEHIIGLLDEMFMEMGRIKFTKDEAVRATMVTEFTTNKGPNCLRQLTQRIQEVGPSGFFAGGDKPSMADIFFVATLELVKQHYPDVLKNESAIQAHQVKVVAALPKMAKYISQRPVTDF